MKASAEFLILHAQLPGIFELPWDIPLEQWPDDDPRLVHLPQGISRHPLRFVNLAENTCALKEMPLQLVEKEFASLEVLQERHLPAVRPLGYAKSPWVNDGRGVLITRYLENSIPYRLLIAAEGFQRYREHLLDALAGLLVQLHLAGFYWGDCSLSNALFRRDAGTLQAYLVDAETSETFHGALPSVERYQDLQIMQHNVMGDILDLQAVGALPKGVLSVPLQETPSYISRAYISLWDEITREVVIRPDEHYRVQERIRALNQLGFSVGDVQLHPTGEGQSLRLKVVVTDRNFHRDQLFNLTGLDAEEKQAQAMINEIYEVRAELSAKNQRSTSLSEAAFHWYQHRYQPVAQRLSVLGQAYTTLAELYVQVLEHKWYLSEREQRDVGHQRAVEDFIRVFGSKLGG